MPETVSQTERDLKAIGHTRCHHRALNEYLKLYGIDVCRVPGRGWRAWRTGKSHEDFTYTVSWLGIDTVKSWFEDPHAMAMQFLGYVKDPALCTRR